MFGLLSAERNLEEGSLRRIVKFLIGFIEKVSLSRTRVNYSNLQQFALIVFNLQEKHARQLAEKLAARLPRCETERQWNDVAYALSLLPHKNEDIAKTVAGGFNKIVNTAPAPAPATATT